MGSYQPYIKGAECSLHSLMQAFLIRDTRFEELPSTYVEAENRTRAKIRYCSDLGLNPLLNADKLDIREVPLSLPQVYDLPIATP